ncbi:hypothetical protein B0G75_13817 [Paraburkholderia sp. BL18I3N2]|nr:hypothetical protein B0G75_13817 [Paraburkholderia sp. BL18I3N2]PRX89410.1 hypothetical protein B0G73_14813 [Paraburkholderia sp. BL25I1N1]
MSIVLLSHAGYFAESAQKMLSWHHSPGRQVSTDLRCLQLKI